MEYKKNTKFLKNLQQNNSEAVTKENDKERYVSAEERQNIIDNLGSILIV